MTNIHIDVTSDTLSINGQVWGYAPSIEQVCQALGTEDLVDGDFITIRGQKVSRFRYFDNIGISIIESIPVRRVERVTIHMQTPPRKRRPPPSRYLKYRTTGECATRAVFVGWLNLNGKQLGSPLRFANFPLKGELSFINRIALGSRISAAVTVELRFVQRVSFTFKQ